MSFWEEHFSKEELDLIPIKNLSNPLNFDRRPWNFSRGAKTIREYLHNDLNFKGIEVEYTYEYPELDGVQNLRKIESYSEKICFYNEDGSLFYHIDVPISLNLKNIREINRAIRFSRIDFLEDSAENLREVAEEMPDIVDQPTINFLISEGQLPSSVNTPALYQEFRSGLFETADSIDDLFTHYEHPILTYKDRGTTEFENAVKNEGNSTILTKLNRRVPPNGDFPNGLTVREAIYYQLTGDING